MTREERKKAYLRVLEVVEKHTGPELGASISERGLRTVLVSNGTLPLDRYKKALSAAFGNGDLLHLDGHIHPPDVAVIRSELEREATSNDPNRQTIGRLNHALDRLDDNNEGVSA